MKDEQGIKNLMGVGLGYDDASHIDSIFWKYMGTREREIVHEKFNTLPIETLEEMEREVLEGLSEPGKRIAREKLEIGKAREMREHNDRLREQEEEWGDNVLNDALDKLMKPNTNALAVEALIQRTKMPREFAEEFVEKFYKNGTMPQEFDKLSPADQVAYLDFQDRLYESGWQKP
ncbi:hypothetical protein SEA_KEELAN_9 [Gordonia phage Keelan]|nr:hypothetical protein SEA_KEELAN_9 [Gordonia phage Keelan]